MTGEQSVHAGGCACRSVLFEARGAPNWVGLCHCASCRRATGGVTVAAAGFFKRHVSITGATRAGFESSSGVVRTFCSACGTSLSYESRRWPDDIHLMVGAFDEPQRLEPEFHIFFGERLSWATPADTLPKFRSTPGEGILVERDERC